MLVILKRACFGVILGTGILSVSAVQGQEFDTVSGVKTMIESLALNSLGPAGDAVAILQNSSDLVKTGLLSWLKNKIGDAIVSGDDTALEKYSSFYVCIANAECEGIRALQANSAPQEKQNDKGSVAGTEPQGNFMIFEAFLPSSVLSGGRKGNLTVYWGGEARFPVTMIYRPATNGCSIEMNCSSPEMTFSSKTDPLIFREAVWCNGVPKSLYFGYEVILRDADGNETAPKPAAFRCQATGN